MKKVSFSSNDRLRINRFVRNSFWLMPCCALILGITLARFLRAVDAHFHWTCLDFTVEGAKALLSTFVASMLTFIVVVASAMLLVVQLVSAILTPRIIGPALQHKIVRASLSVFAFAYAMSTAVLGRLGDDVPQLATAVAICVNIVGLLFFMYFVGAVGMALRPAAIMAMIAAKGHRLIESTYPFENNALENVPDEASLQQLSDAAEVIRYDGAPGVLMAFDATGLVAEAQRNDATIELMLRVGDYVAAGEPLFRLEPANSVRPKSLLSAIAVGPERTFEQDPRLAFRLLVDIASKALSPAINDPTTAVLAIDQLHRLLRQVGNRRLYSGVLKDGTGKVRVIFATPSWEDFIWLTTAEIRNYSGRSIRVCQRMHAMFEHLISVLHEARRPPLRQHRRMLLEAVERNFPAAEDRERIAASRSAFNGASTDV